MYFAGAVFEGYIISRLNFALLCMLLFSAMGGRIIHLYRSGELGEAPEREWMDEPELDEPYYDDAIGAAPGYN
jgi:hypothetical protein